MIGLIIGFLIGFGLCACLKVGKDDWFKQVYRRQQ